MLPFSGAEGACWQVCALRTARATEQPPPTRLWPQALVPSLLGVVSQTSAFLSHPLAWLDRELPRSHCPMGEAGMWEVTGLDYGASGVLALGWEGCG